MKKQNECGGIFAFSLGPSANRAPSVASPFKKYVNAAAPTAANTAKEGARADYKFCSKESILDQLKCSIEETNSFHKTSEEINRIKITLKHAAKWIMLNSFSSPLMDTRKRTSNLPDSGGRNNYRG